MGVLASDDYDPADYIRDYDEFRGWLNGIRQGDGPVPYLDLRRAHDSIRPEMTAAIASTIDAGQFIGGPLLADFERDFAAYCDTGYAVGAANGLEALQLALLAKGIGQGDEVLIPAHTFVATALAVTLTGAKPVLVDVEDDTGNIDPTAIEGALTPRSRAIVPVHLYGHPADMDAIGRIATARGLFVLEDSAQAHGALYRNRRCGSLGDAAAFSFYPTKNLGAIGDAGAVTTSHGDFAAEVRLLGNYGSARRYNHEKLGFNSRTRSDPGGSAVGKAEAPRCLERPPPRTRHPVSRWTVRSRRDRVARCARLGNAGLARLPDPGSGRPARGASGVSGKQRCRDEHPLPDSRPSAALLRGSRLRPLPVSGRRPSGAAGAQPAARRASYER